MVIGPAAITIYGILMPIILILALIVAGGGISYEAQQALPGEPLYIVKTDINEPVMAFISGGGEARVHVLEEQAAERLTESEQLANVGFLDAHTKAELQTSFQEKSAAALGGIKALADSGNMTAANEQTAAFQSILTNHQVALKNLSADQGSSAGMAADMESSVAVRLGDAADVHSSINGLAVAPGAPEAGGVETARAVTNTNTEVDSEESTSTFSGSAAAYLMASTSAAADSIGSAILSLLSKVI